MPQSIARCSWCTKQFLGYQDLMEHKGYHMANGNGHIHCVVCGLDFRTWEAQSKHTIQATLPSPSARRLSPEGGYANFCLAVPPS